MGLVIVVSKCTSFGLQGWSKDQNKFGWLSGLVLFRCGGAWLNGGGARSMSFMSRFSGRKPTDTEPVYGRRNFLKQSAVSLGMTVHEFIKHRDAKSSQEEKSDPVRTD